jgi:TPR repeat protein
VRKRERDRVSVVCLCLCLKVRLKGSTITKDEEEGVAWLRSAAISGDAGAQYELGRCHDEGRGVEQDVAGAIKWYN